MSGCIEVEVFDFNAGMKYDATKVKNRGNPSCKY
jgi:hypothetical protein